jgi:CHAD domain-containing protein
MKKTIPRTPLAVALKKRAMALDADIPRLLRPADRLLPRHVHATRVVTKRLRAWWRLMLPLAGRTAVRNAERRLADVAEFLAPARDAEVMRQILRQLGRRAKSDAVRATIEMAARQLAAIAPSDAPAPEFPQLREQIIHAFKSDAAAWRRLPVTADIGDSLVAEAARTYRRVRRRGRRVTGRDSPRDLHAWRLWVKVHLHQIEFLAAGRGRTFEELIRQLIRLGRMLGRGQDLATLDGWVTWRESIGALGRKEARRLHALLVRRQDELRTRCERLGRRLFAVKPKVYAAKLQERLADRGRPAPMRAAQRH